MAPAETVYRPTPPARPKGVPLPEKPLELPYCNRCLKHLAAHQWMSTYALLTINVLLWGTVVAARFVHLSIAWIVPAMVGACLYVFARVRLSRAMITTPECAGSEIVMRCVWFRRNIYIFSFASDRYAAEFARANKHILASADDN